MKIILNERQSKLLGHQCGYSLYRENLEFRDLKKKLFQKTTLLDGTSVEIARRNSRLEIKSLERVKVGEIKNFNKFCRETFGFIPKQITNYNKFIGEISKYQTESFIIHYGISQSEEQPIKILNFNSHTEAHPIEKSQGGIIWVTFYDNDKKMTAYEFYPQRINMPKKYAIDKNLDTDRYLSVKFKPKAFSVKLTPNLISPRHIMLTGLGDEDQLERAKSFYLWVDQIEVRKYDAISNLEANVISIFDGNLL